MSVRSAPLPRDDELPGTLHEFTEYVGEEARCEELLRRWKYGGKFRCPRCQGERAWYLPSRRLDQCCVCGKQVSLTAGTVMHRSRKPLRLWFLAMFLFGVSKQGISALDLSRQLGLHYKTAWSWLHKLRAAAGRRTLHRLRGLVEADETWEGGLHEGHSGRPRAGEKKALIAAVIELRKPKGFGRVRLAVLQDGSAASLTVFLSANVEPGSVLRSDGWRSYPRAANKAGLELVATNVSKSEHKAHTVLPGVHRVFSLVHRLLLTTYQGAVSMKHLPKYLVEYEFRFNRRNAKSRGLLFQRLLSAAIIGPPQPYWQILGRCAPDQPLRAAA